MWFKVDDKFPDHPKVANLSPAEISLWLFAGCYCGEYETDGFIPRTVAFRLAARLDPQDQLMADVPRLVRGLVAAGLWTERGTGYIMHDYLDYNPSRAELERERKRKRLARRRRHLDEKRERRNADGTRPIANRGVRGTSGERPGNVHVASGRRPDPTRPVVSTSVSSSLTVLGERESEGKGGDVGRLVDLYRAVGIEPTTKDGPLIAGLVKRYGAARVEAKIRELGPSIVVADNPGQYLAGACRYPHRAHETVSERAKRYEQMLREGPQ